MAYEIREFQVTVPAQTAQSAGFSVPITFPARVVDEIDIRVPPGPNGQMGFAIGTSGMPVIPAQLGSWIIANDQEIDWPLQGYWDSGSWEVFAYNLGNYPHTLYLTFLLSLVQSQATSPAPIGAADLSQPVSLAGVPT